MVLTEATMSARGFLKLESTASAAGARPLESASAAAAQADNRHRLEYRILIKDLRAMAMIWRWRPGLQETRAPGARRPRREPVPSSAGIRARHPHSRRAADESSPPGAPPQAGDRAARPPAHRPSARAFPRRRLAGAGVQPRPRDSGRGQFRKSPARP